MSIQERQQTIVELLEQRGACSYQELIEHLGVSAMTARRDVDRLVSQGRAIKALGGVQRADAPAYWYENELSARMARQVAQKRAIAERAVGLLEAGTTLYLDGGTTCLELARQLGRRRSDLIVVTNSAAACMELCRSGGNSVIGLGGECDPASLCFVGPDCEEAAGRYFVDVAFVSTKGFVPDEGTFESSPATFRIKQVMAKRSSQVVLLADHTKFGQRALSKVLDISEISDVVTDALTPEEDLETLCEMGKDVHVVDVEHAEVS